jgi:hypothetical protein
LRTVYFITLVCTPIFAENTSKVITEDRVISSLDAWQEYANSGEVKASMALLSKSVILEVHLPNANKKCPLRLWMVN